MSGATTIDGRAREGSRLGSTSLRDAVRMLLKAARTGMAGRRVARQGLRPEADSALTDGARRTIAGQLAAEAWAGRLAAEADDAAELAAGFGRDAVAAVGLAEDFARLLADEGMGFSPREVLVLRGNLADAEGRAYRCARMAARLCAEVYELREHAASALQSAALYARCGGGL